MARHQSQISWFIGMAAALLWMVLTVASLSSAEARMGGFGGSRGGFGGGFHGGFGGGFHSGSHIGFGHGFHGGFGHGFHGGFTHHFATNHTFVGHHFFFHPFNHHFHHPIHRNVFFFNVGIGGFFPFYPVAYPYPVYQPAYPPYPYSPCGYYDPYGNWINAPCPQYAPPVSAPQQESSPQGVSAPPAQASEGAVGPQPPGY